MPFINEVRAKLIEKLKELFQLDQPELDFGFYRIMHAKSREITEFLDKDLLGQVQSALREYVPEEKVAVKKQLNEVIKSANLVGVDPETTPKVIELREKLAESVDLDRVELEVYNDLYRFFCRYYSEGDFISQRVYKEGVYAIPYEGEEVKLHWANSDQYYIKTSEYLRDYAFRINGGGKRIHFRLVDATEGSHNNVKEANGKARLFALADDDFMTIENDELVVRFQYKPSAFSQAELLTQATESILAQNGKYEEWMMELAKPYIKSNGETADYSKLMHHLKKYTARNTFDYFIHKDLRTFLSRELDFFIKNEIMHLDDLEGAMARRVEQYLSRLKAMRRVARKVIEFLAQLEDFQKRLWLKKKFVIETNYCITLDRISEEFYAEIAANDAQREEWVRLFAIDEIKKTNGDLMGGTSPCYSVPLKKSFLAANQNLVLDTKFFDESFKERLLASIENFDDNCNGLLIHSENFQALQFLQQRYKEQIKCIYIDPPYNTGNDGFVYKDGYQHASWISMIQNRLELLPHIADDRCIFFSSIDDNEIANYRKCLSLVLGNDAFNTQITVQSNKRGQTYQSIAKTHEYLLVYEIGENAEINEMPREIAESAMRDEFGPYELWELRNRNPKFGKYNRPNLYYPIYVSSEVDDNGYAKISLVAGKQFPNEIYPKNSEDGESCWRWSKEKVEAETQDNGLRVLVGKRKNGNGWGVFQKSRKESVKAKSIWAETEVINEQGTIENRQLGFTEFGFPKPVTLLSKIVQLGADDDSTILDYFAGSGTTGHAVINLNREDGGSRKYILVEMGDYFDTVLKPRIQKVIYSKDWKDGKPTNRDSGISHCFKYIRLESYEDTLANIAFSGSDELRCDVALDPDLKEEYMLRYFLETESRESPVFLGIKAFFEPTHYCLKIKKPGSDESDYVKIDLLETFNYLIGLKVDTIGASQRFATEFKRDDEKRLQLKSKIKPSSEGKWWFRFITGRTLDGQKVLIIWRNRPGGETPEGMEEDNLVLDAWFESQGYCNTAGQFDTIYVNGTSNLANLQNVTDNWKIQLVEEVFHRSMFG